jgi:hypothetical protein
LNLRVKKKKKENGGARHSTNTLNAERNEG